MKKILTAIALLALVTAPAIADEAPPPTLRVAIEVTVSDEDLRDRVSMYLRNELRNLGDVEVTDENPDFKLYAMVTEMRSGTGQRVAYVLGISVVNFFPDGYFDSILDDRLRNADEIARKLEAVTVYRNQFLSVSGPEEAHLIETAVNSIARLNTHIFQPEREPSGGQ